MNLKKICVPLAIGLMPLAGSAQSEGESDDKPNFVLFFLDDSGWGDFRPPGNPDYSTPNVERLANKGIRHDDFYVPQAVCTASRAAILTGTFPGRNRVFGAHMPGRPALDPKFVTLAEVLKKAGYATGMFGKWHVGDVDGQRPLDRGFDEYHGIYYSHDMWKHNPANPKFWGKFPLVYWENDKPKVEDCDLEDQDQFTTWITEAAVDFIDRNADRPFFCYIPHPQPHVPLHVSDKFRGKSGQGLYGDVIMELDWSVGQVLDALEKKGLTEKTVVIFTSDNGPWMSYGNHAGNTPFREGKRTSFNGGCRMAFIIRYPKEIQPGAHSKRVWSSVDILPSLAGLAKAPLPDGEIDGHDIWPIISGQSDAPHPADFIEITNEGEFQAMVTLNDKWKLHFPHKYRTMEGGRPGKDGKPGKYAQNTIGFSLFNLEEDPGETKNVITEHPEVASRLIEAAEKHRQKWFPKQKPISLN